MKKSNTKLNDGCLKIFELLNLLYEDKADYHKVISIFKDDVNEQSTNNVQVILNKYINTLKVFGIKVEKENNKFKLKSSLYSMPFSTNDLKSISILQKSIKDFPDNDISEILENFIETLMLRMDNHDKNKLNNLTQNYDFSFYYSNLREQIDHCIQICKENFIIEVLYLKNNNEIKIKCTPKEVLYDLKTAYLQVYDIQKKENIDIPIANIRSIARQPQIANPTELTTTVVYILKNRLAKTYKVKENEYAQGYDSNGYLTIINKNEPFDKLLSRLMRYNYNCEIISPKPLRDKMINLINETLAQYEDIIS
ncbi:hypothetical protein HDR58_08770 [bacterium]|nr:hypothetical protein [bacterium]